MKIHIKLVGFVSVALVIPLLLGIFYVRHVGRLYYQKQQGIIHLMIAEELAGTLQNGVRQKFEQVLNWASISPLPSLVAAVPALPPDMADILKQESTWSDSPGAESFEQQILLSSVSASIRAFQQLNPEFAEILMTDRYGRLIGASNPTTDFWQADEAWWTSVSNSPAGSGHVHGLVYDRSAGVMAIDMVFPVYSAGRPAEFLGVLKVSLDATRFLQRAAPQPWSRAVARDLVFPDGRMFACINLGDSPEFPLLPIDVMQHLLVAPDRWGVVEIFPGTRSLTAIAPVRIMESADGTARGELYAVVSRDLDATLMPVRDMLRELTLWGVAASLLMALMASLLATYWLARPIKKLRNASESFVHYIKQSEAGRFEEAWENRQKVRQHMAELETIHNHDELQGLARDFIRMGDRMLVFFRQIEDRLPDKKK
jgi:hypothetical protein